MTLTKLLKDKKMTQMEFADQLNVSQSTVSKWCRGVCCPKVSVVYKMTKLLNVSLEDIILCFEENLNEKSERS